MTSRSQKTKPEQIHPKITRILPFTTREKNVNQIKRERPRKLHQLSLNLRPQGPAINDLSFYPSVCRSLSNLKRLKYLTRLDLDLNMLVDSERVWIKRRGHPKMIQIMIHSFAHLKNLRLLHLYISQPSSPFLKAKVLVDFCKALKQAFELPHLEIKFSLWTVGNSQMDEFNKIVRGFSHVKRLTSASLTFDAFTNDLLQIQELIARLKESESLSRLSITFSHTTMWS